MASLRGVPLYLYPSHETLSFSNFTINSGGGTIDRLSWSIQMPADTTDTLTHICFRYGVRTGTPVAHDIGLQGFDTSRMPDGTWKGGGSPNKGSFTPPADATWDSTWREIALDNSYVTSRGEILCVVVEPTGTPDGSNNSSFTRTTGPTFGFPTTQTQTDGGSWTRANSLPLIAVKSATRVYGIPAVAAFGTNIGTNGHRQANKLTIPAGVGNTFQVIGLQARIASPAAGFNFKLGIWDGAGTELTGISLDSDGFTSTLVTVYFDDAPVSLDCGTAYYFGMERVDTTTRIAGVDVHDANDMTAYPFSTDCHGATWDGASWTNVTTRRHFCFPILEDITEPSGGGGAALLLGGALVQ